MYAQLGLPHPWVQGILVHAAGTSFCLESRSGLQEWIHRVRCTCSYRPARYLGAGRPSSCCGNVSLFGESVRTSGVNTQSACIPFNEHGASWQWLTFKRYFISTHWPTVSAVAVALSAAAHLPCLHPHSPLNIVPLGSDWWLNAVTYWRNNPRGLDAITHWPTVSAVAVALSAAARLPCLHPHLPLNMVPLGSDWCLNAIS